MNRLDRLTAILIHLQSKKIVTARELSKRFNISIRTVYRDIRSLEAAGVPIDSEAGLGYYLVEGYHLPPVMLTSEEAGALLLACKLSYAFTDEKTKNNVDSAMYKIKAVLKNEDKEFLSEIEKRIQVFSAENYKIPAENNTIRDIQNAMYAGKIINIEYYSPSGSQTTSRRIEPISLGFFANHWHLIAFCHLRKAYRNFRIDRIEKLSITNQSIKQSHPPIEEIIKKMYASKNLSSVTVRLRKDSNYEIIKNKCALGFLAENNLGDRVEIVLLTDSLKVLGKWLLYYGNDVEILHPDEMKTVMREHAAEIARQYLGTSAYS
ncbi:MAG: YafY family transcriptional regulator [Clostridiaceae bacterium]|nr:YafY family transcriptional regulator [Clostridiaceae bacterium]